MSLVDIRGLDPAAVLLALYENAGAPRGMAALGTRTTPLSLDEAANILGEQQHHGGHIDYLFGRPLKIRIPLGATSIDTSLYDRDSITPGAEVVARLRDSGR